MSRTVTFEQQKNFIVVLVVVTTCGSSSSNSDDVCLIACFVQDEEAEIKLEINVLRQVRVLSRDKCNNIVWSSVNKRTSESQKL